MNEKANTKSDILYKGNDFIQTIYKASLDESVYLLYRTVDSIFKKTTVEITAKNPNFGKLKGTREDECSVLLYSFLLIISTADSYDNSIYKEQYEELKAQLLYYGNSTIYDYEMDNDKGWFDMFMKNRHSADKHYYTKYNPDNAKFLLYIYCYYSDIPFDKISDFILDKNIKSKSKKLN